MSNQGKDAPSPRRYPGGYEKLVPIALGFIALAIVVLLAVIVAVAVGLIPPG